MNSRDCVQKLKDLKVLPSKSLVSFDVTALFTPTEETVKEIRQRLTQNLSWQVRTNLNSDQLIQLLQSCFDTTYFMFKGNFHKQGSSPNLYIEHFEQIALSIAPTPTDVCNRYVDDTFTIMHCCSIGI